LDKQNSSGYIKLGKWLASGAAAGLAIWAVVYVARADLSVLSDFDLRWSYFFAVIPLYFGVVLARGARIKMMTGSSQPLGLFSSIGAIHTFITKILPFRTGEMFLPIMLKRYRVMGLLKGSGVLVAIRLIDFLIMFLALFISSFFARNDYFYTYWAYLSAALLVCIFALLGILVLVVRGRRSWVASKLPLRLRTSLGIDESEGEGAAKGLRMGPVLWGGFFSSLAAWLFVFASFFFLLPWAGVEDLTFPQVILGSAGAVVAGFLPINTLLSLGTIEAGWAASLYLVGVDPSMGVIVGFRMHGAIFFFNIIMALGGFVCMNLFWKRSRSE